MRVLYADGEMPGELVKVRAGDAMRWRGRTDLCGNLFIYSADTAEQTAAVRPGLGIMPSLNAEPGHAFLDGLIEMLGGVDVVVFDNVMSPERRGAVVGGDTADHWPNQPADWTSMVRPRRAQ